MAVCLCHIVEKLETDPDHCTDECELGDVLEWIYQVCGAEAPVSHLILQTLKLDSPPGHESGGSITDHSPIRLDSRSDNSSETDKVHGKDRTSNSESNLVECLHKNKKLCSEINNCCERMDGIHVKLDGLSVSMQDLDVSVPK